MADPVADHLLVRLGQRCDDAVSVAVDMLRHRAAAGCEGAARRPAIIDTSGLGFD